MDQNSAGDVGMTVRIVAEKFRKLKAAYEAKDDVAAEDHLEDCKQKMIFFPTFLNVSASSATRAQEILLVREVLEHAVLLSARKKNVEEMERYFNMLRTYYDDVDVALVPESSVMHLIIGLNLMRLLVCHRIAEFHSELERMAPENQRNQYLRFAMQLERYLMEGSYNKLLHARGQAPSNEYVSVVELLEGTVRAEVGRCMPAAYASITVQDAGATMMIKSEEDVRSIGERNGWKTSEDGLQFEFSRDVDATKRELPFMQILQQQIAFAADLQRVV